MNRPVYAVIEGEKLIGTAGTIKLARRHRTGIGGRRIIKHDPKGERIALRAFRGDRFYIYGWEVE